MENACVEEGDKSSLTAAPENCVKIGQGIREDEVKRSDKEGGECAKGCSGDKAEKCGNQSDWKDAVKGARMTESCDKAKKSVDCCGDG